MCCFATFRQNTPGIWDWPSTNTRVVFRSFPLFVCQQFQNKQTNTLRSCFHVALYSTFFSGTRLTQVSVIFSVLSVSQSLIPICSQLNLFRENCLKIALKCFHYSLARSSRHLRRFVLQPFSVRRLRHDCKSIRVCQTCNSR